MECEQGLARMKKYLCTTFTRSAARKARRKDKQTRMQGTCMEGVLIGFEVADRTHECIAPSGQ